MFNFFYQTLLIVRSVSDKNRRYRALLSKSTKLGRMVSGYIRYNFRRGTNTTNPGGEGRGNFVTG